MWSVITHDSATDSIVLQTSVGQKFPSAYNFKITEFFFYILFYGTPDLSLMCDCI